MLVGVPSNTEVSYIEDTVQTVKALGRVRVRDTKLGPSPGTLLILCECKEVIDPNRVPAELLLADGEQSWKVIVAPVDISTSEFSKKFEMFLTAEGKTMTDIQALFAPPHSSAASPESIIRAVGELLEKTSKPPGETNAYRRLRTFSGIIPTPAGEESLENWIEQARLMADECECSEKEKRRRIMESLKGPALDIIKAVRFSTPAASASQYLEALENTFGTSESGEDLYFAFRLLRQYPGEALSDFLCRIEKSLSKVVIRGGLTPQMMDRTRLEQLIRGAVEADLMLLQLRLRERREQPPTFLALLNEVKEAEENEAARHKIKASVKHIQLKTETTLDSSVVRQLRAEIQELRSRFVDDPKPVSVTSMRVNQKDKPDKKKPETQEESEVQMLKKQIQQLQQQLTVMSISSSNQSQQALTNPRSVPGYNREMSVKHKADFFCYRCGEDGHIATKCQAPENTSQVIQKLVRALRKAKNEKNQMTEASTTHSSSDCFSKRSQIEVCGISQVPRGLVGPASTISVELNGCPCQALLDSGSQVTIVFDQWYSKHLSQLPLHPLTGLSIWGLSSSSYPYKGYIIVDVLLPASITGVKEKVSILALVCPEPQGPQQCPVIIGTNASFFKRLTLLNQDVNDNQVNSMRIQLSTPSPA